MSQITNQNIATEARTANIAGLVIVIGSTILAQGMVKPEDTMVYQDLGDGSDWVPLFGIALPNSNSNVFGNVVNKYSNVTDIIQQLHRQTYLNAHESAVTPLHVDREAVSKLLLVAGGVVGVNVWTTLNNPASAVKGSFMFDDARVLFSRYVSGSNIVTEFEELEDETYVHGNHEVLCDGVAINIPGVTTQQHTFINSAIVTKKVILSVAGGMYNPSTEQVFRKVCVDGGVMLSPEEQYLQYSKAGILAREAVVIQDGTHDNYLVTARHEANPELQAALRNFDAVQVPGTEVGTDDDNQAGDENYALKG